MRHATPPLRDRADKVTAMWAANWLWAWAAAIIALPALLTPGPVAGQALRGLQSGDLPLEINAEEGIEWRRDEQLYVARGNASAARGNLTVYADEMTAHYRQTQDKGSDIDRIDVIGNVRIVSPTETVYGDRGAYDVINGVLVLVGEDLRLIGESDTITARDSLEYWETKQMAVARGEAEAVREDKRVKADVLTAHFEPGPDGSQELKRIEGFGNVRITTPQEYARGNRGTYYVDRELASLAGDVKITREDNQLNGEFAEVNLKTGISRLLPGPPGSVTKGGDKRVRGLLLPKRKPESEAETQ